MPILKCIIQYIHKVVQHLFCLVPEHAIIPKRNPVCIIVTPYCPLLKTQETTNLLSVSSRFNYAGLFI